MLPIKEYFANPSILKLSLLEHFGSFLPDKQYLSLMYRYKMGRKLDLLYPKRYTEKLQWLKLYDRQTKYTALVDKYAVKSYVADIIGEHHIIPTIGVWNSPQEIDWSSLPNQFVLKTTNGGGGTSVFICRDKRTFDIQKVSEKLSRSLKVNIYKRLREWPYKNVPPRIIAEKYMEDESGELRDYKFYCFNGEPRVMIVATDRFVEHNFNYYDMDFNPLPIHSAVGGVSKKEIKRPAHLDEMIEVSRKLAAGFAHVRVDLYYVNQIVYFGELTLYDSSGFDNMCSDEVDLQWGSWITLPDRNK